MSQEDAELLRLIREWRPSAALHPIAMQAWHVYEDGGHSLSDESVEQLKGALDGYGDDLMSLGQALEGLVRFSILLSDHQNDPTGAEKVVGLIRQYSALFEPLWARVAEAIANVGISAPASETLITANHTADDSAPAEPNA